MCRLVRGRNGSQPGLRNVEVHHKQNERRRTWVEVGNWVLEKAVPENIGKRGKTEKVSWRTGEEAQEGKEENSHGSEGGKGERRRKRKGEANREPLIRNQGKATKPNRNDQRVYLKFAIRGKHVRGKLFCLPPLGVQDLSTEAPAYRGDPF